MKIQTFFIDSSAWIAIADKNNPLHDSAQMYFNHLLEINAKLVSNNVEIDEAIVQLKKRSGAKSASRFLNIIDEAVLTIHLKVDWVSRRVRRNGLSQYLNCKDEQIGLRQFFIYESVMRKHAEIIFSFDSALKYFNIPLMPQTEVNK